MNRLCRLPLAMSASLLALVAMPLQARATARQHYYALVFTSPVPGREADYNRWYDRQHGPDVVSIPGFVRAQRYVRSDLQMRPDAPDSPPYLIVYEIVTGDLPAVFTEVNRRAADGRTAMSDTVARTGGMNVTYHAAESRHWRLPTGPDAALHIVMADPQPGEDAQLAKWYARHHAPDMAALPGFTSYQLGTAASVQMVPDTHARARLALFAIHTSTLSATIDAFRATAPHMTRGPAMRNLWGFTYRPIGPSLSGDAIRRERRKAH